MALFMEKKGEVVSDLIFGDSIIRSSPAVFNYKEYIENLKKDKNISEEERSLLDNQIVVKQMESRLKSYHHFLNEIKMDRAIHANIHQLLAEKEESREGFKLSRNWEAFTRRDVFIYYAQGKHSDLFNLINISDNGEIINKILAKIQSKVPLSRREV